MRRRDRTVLAVSACGGGARQDANEPKRQVPGRRQRGELPRQPDPVAAHPPGIDVRNAGSKTIPDVAVTICNVTCAYPAPKGEGTSAAAFAADLNQTGLANPSRPVWVVDQRPGACGTAAQNGGAGAGVTAYANTWALGTPAARARPSASTGR